jgi:ATP-binding cassette, subfamily B, bacterial
MFSTGLRTLANSFHNFLTPLSYLPRTLRLVWTATGNWTLAWGVLLVVQGLLPAAAVYLTKIFVDSLVVAVNAGASWESTRQVLFVAVFMGGVLLLIELIQSASTWIRTAQAEIIRDHLSALIHEKSVAVDIAFYESPEYHDRLEQARNDLSNRPLALLEAGGALLQNGVTLLAIAALLVPYGAWLPLALAVSTAPALWVVLHYNLRYHRWWNQTTPHRRWADYYDNVLTNSRVAPELRLFDLGFYFQAAYQHLRGGLRTERLKLTRDQAIARLFAGLFGLLISGLAIGWMVWQVLQRQATLGELALFYQAFNQGQVLLRALLESAGQIYTNTLFLGNLFDFLKIKPEVLDPPAPVAPPYPVRLAIRFEDVSFYYPGTHKPVLQEFNLTIPAGQIVALVGANGAGKTTLQKLLCRFYDPQKGQITIDGIDIRQLSINELRRLITVLFQWPVPYQATAAENIALGDLSADPAMPEIEAAARCAGAHEVIARLSQGYNTRLGRWFSGGTDLSVGEWQRLALARAFLRRAQIMILDEPTSALDSWAEVDWFDRFRSLSKGRTAIVITHRLTIARHADIIHVMDAGAIVESGTHDELVARGDLYARSWFAQIRDSAGVSAFAADEELLPPQIVCPNGDKVDTRNLKQL